MDTKCIGAPNSIARYVRNAFWGNNKWAVFERIKGELVLIAAQTTQESAERYMLPGRTLVDIDNLRIVQETKLPKGRQILSTCTDLDGTLKAVLFSDIETNPIMIESCGSNKFGVWNSSEPESVCYCMGEDEARKLFRSCCIHGTDGFKA